MSERGALRLPEFVTRGLSGGGRQAEIVPQARLSGPIPWVIAIMVGLMVIAAAGVLALRNTGQAAARELSGGITVQIVEARTEERARQAEQVLALLRRQPGVLSAELVPQAELDALIEPWLGDSTEADDDDLAQVPVPALIDARLKGAIDPALIARLQQSLRAAVPAARVDAQSTWLKPVFGAIKALQWLALALIVLLSLATGAAVLLAARTALGNNRATIDVVHLLGGTDAQIARIFQRSIAVDAAGGGIAGFAAAVVVIFFLGRSFAALQAGLVTGAALTLGDWAILLIVPLTAVMVAMLTARWTVIRALQRML